MTNRNSSLKTTKPLKLYNGRLTYKRVRGHGYIAAYSDADAIRILDQVVGGRGNRKEITVYWSKGAWGNQMDGVTPERGLWFIDSENRYAENAPKPKRIL